MPKISIITVNYNNDLGLQKTIESVIGQNYSNIEYIIIDGNSSDNSVTLLKKYDSKITNWVSEPDSGIYQAMNKGILSSTGDYLLFLNSGDTLHTNSTIDKVSKKIIGGKDIYYGNLLFKSKKKEYVNEYPNKITFSYFYNNRSIPHPGAFIKRSIFESVFYYNEKLKYVSDWEFFMCAICKYDVSYKHIDIVVSDFDLQGMSNDPANKIAFEEERKVVLQDHFSSFLDDMEELAKARYLLGLNKVKMLLELEKSKLGRKIITLSLKTLLRLFRNKSSRDL